MKIAIVTDSNSGVTQAQAKELGITVIPMPFMNTLTKMAISAKAAAPFEITDR